MNREGNPEYLKLLDEMKEMHLAKSAGYAGDNPDHWANFRMSTMLGITPFKGCLVRMSDKFIRICNLTSNPNNDKVGESIMDTLLDLAVYSLIAICLYREGRDRE